MSRHATSERGIVRDRESDIEYGHYVGPPFRPYERDAILPGRTDIPVDEWDRLATDNPVSLRFRNRNHGAKG